MPLLQGACPPLAPFCSHHEGRGGEEGEEGKEGTEGTEGKGGKEGEEGKKGKEGDERREETHVKQKGISKMPVNTPNTSIIANVHSCTNLPPITCSTNPRQGPSRSNHHRVSARLTEKDATRKAHGAASAERRAGAKGLQEMRLAKDQALYSAGCGEICMIAHVHAGRACMRTRLHTGLGSSH